MTPTLFQPLALRSVIARNRIWLSPMCQYSVAERDGVVGAWQQVFLGARAAGGFGLILSEATAVLPEGRISPQDAGIWTDAQAEAWKPVAAFCREQGAAFGLQLAHAGRKAGTYRAFPGEPKGVLAEADAWEAVGPSAIAYPGYRTPAELSTDEIHRTVDAFAAAARRAHAAGCDVVEIHGAHGYLLHEFCSPLSNLRTDDYGGDFAGRTRIVLEVIDAVRSEWPADLPLLLRISATDWTDDGWTVADSARLAPLARDRGVDLVDVSSGANVPAPMTIGPGYQVPFAAEVRAAGVPTAAVGLITEPQQAETVLATGQADAVMLGRVALREPAWPLRAAHELGVPVAEAPYAPQEVRGAWR